MDTVIVIMQKNKKTGLFEKELQTLNISQYEDFILNIYAENEEDDIFLKIKLTTNRDVLDWEYNAIYDYYDTEIFQKEGYYIKECDEEYNPTWEISTKYIEDEEQILNTINKIVKMHKDEISEVFEIIKDKEGEYADEK